jgi:hypothetical protein
MGWRVNGSVDVNLAVENIFNDVHSEWVTGDDVLYRGKIFGRTGNAAIVWHF